MLLESIIDGRREHRVIYPLQFLLLGSILEVFSGAYNPATIHEFFLRGFADQPSKASNSIIAFLKN
ncbi:MAG: hypothetical protein HEQ14_19640 [Aphanizomenon flos-aquae CP01]|jgi:hypothetical protein|nr:hypothetical protein [Aphanizomenon flos-aquae CP01]